MTQNPAPEMPVNMNYENHIMYNNLIPFIFHYNVRTNRTAMYGNWHDNVEVLCFVEGSGTVTYDLSNIPVKAGDVVVINSDVFHDILSDSQIEYYCLIVDTKFCRTNGINIPSVRFQPLIQDQTLCEFFPRIQELFSKRPPFYETKLRIMVLELLVYLMEHYPSNEAEEDAGFSSHVKQAITYIKYHYFEEISVEDILKHVGFSRAYFSREFKRNTGVSLVTYLNMVRCRQAQILLSQKCYSISQIASMCGFNNASYFTKTYKKIMGRLPSETIEEDY